MAIARGEYTVSTLKDSTKKVYFAYADSPDGLTNFSLEPGTRTYLGTFVDEDRDVLQAAVDAPVVAGDGRNSFSLTVVQSLPVSSWTVPAYLYNIMSAPYSEWTLSTNLPQGQNSLYFNGGNATDRMVYEGVSLTRLVPEYGSIFVAIPTNRPHTQTIRSGEYWVKLEKGTTATPWTPAPEDVLAELDGKIADPSSYTWVLIKGAKGDTGSQGPKGDTGNTGATGRGVTSVVKQFYLSTSKTTQTGGTWSTSMPTWEFGKYLWARDLITYTTGTPATSTTTPQVSSEWEAVVSHDADLTAHGIKFTEISQTVNGLGEVVGTHTTNISELTATSLEISQTLEKGGENLLPNPTFGTKNMADKGGWSTGYLMQLLAARFAGKTMAEMLVTLQGKTIQDLIDYNY